MSTFSDMSDLSRNEFDDISLDELSVLSPLQVAEDDIPDAFPHDGTDRRQQISRAILTYFPDTVETIWLEPDTFFTDPKSLILNWVGQYEVCPSTAKLHVHIYVEFIHHARPRFEYLLQTWRHHGLAVNIRRSQRSSAVQRQGAVNYCTDDEKRKLETRVYLWPHCSSPSKMVYSIAHAKPKTQSKDDKVEDMRVYIESKPMSWTWDKIVHETTESKKLLAVCSWGPKYHAGRHASVPRRNVSAVHLWYGAGGTGKTTNAMAYKTQETPDKDERYYRRNHDDGNFWGGGRTAYKGQQVIHYEEFAGQEPFNRLKEICDLGKPGPAVNIKQSGIDLNHDTVIFTSNVHPAGWFNNMWNADKKQFHPFWRRVTQVSFFPAHRPDGSLNVPDSDNPPFIIDQTADWVGFNGDYDAALDHAEQHWPLKQVPQEGFVPGFNLGSNN
ncbi:MAG: putative replication-associated protein [Bacilladnaviridae sp.]|uniref:Replication-associated protein n=1 Tax=Bacilladnaviridae sp. isolate ctdc18 TaxID=3070177 RepID=A0A345MP96_9VIRU|nr:MAG: putative replication-associated protein [Bacilladnaviridae sp.]AXH73196.1 MAG: putative replication-associated protein [Bacilladnaviridae sp. isolate ctdc18]